MRSPYGSRLQCTCAPISCNFCALPLAWQLRGATTLRRLDCLHLLQDCGTCAPRRPHCQGQEYFFRAWITSARIRERIFELVLQALQKSSLYALTTLSVFPLRCFMILAGITAICHHLKVAQVCRG